MMKVNQVNVYLYFHGIGKVSFLLENTMGILVDWRVHQLTGGYLLISVFGPSPFQTTKVEVSNLAEKQCGFGAPSKALCGFCG